MRRFIRLDACGSGGELIWEDILFILDVQLFILRPSDFFISSAHTHLRGCFLKDLHCLKVVPSCRSSNSSSQPSYRFWGTQSLRAMVFYYGCVIIHGDPFLSIDPSCVLFPDPHSNQRSVSTMKNGVV